MCRGPWPQGTDGETWGRHTLSDNSLISSEDRTERCGVNRHFWNNGAVLPARGRESPEQGLPAAVRGANLRAGVLGPESDAGEPAAAVPPRPQEGGSSLGSEYLSGLVTGGTAEGTGHGGLAGISSGSSAVLRHARLSAAVSPGRASEQGLLALTCGSRGPCSAEAVDWG